MMDTVELKVSCIEEERLGFGIGDFAEIVIASSSAGSGSLVPLGPFEVVKVVNSKTAVLKLHHQAEDMSEFTALIIGSVKQGAVTIKKVRSPYEPLHYLSIVTKLHNSPHVMSTPSPY